MVKVKGIQAAPAEIEDLLLRHEKVADCAVIGVRDSYAGGRFFAFVVLKDGVDGGRVEEEIMRWVREGKMREKSSIGWGLLKGCRRVRVGRL